MHISRKKNSAKPKITAAKNLNWASPILNPPKHYRIAPMPENEG